MVRVTYGAPRRQKKVRYFKQARGNFRGRHALWRTVRETLLRAWAYAFAGRKQRKRHFRRLWIIRVNAAARMRGLRYGEFIHGLKQAGIELNRKQLSELAIHDPRAFDTLADMVKGSQSKAIAGAR